LWHEHERLFYFETPLQRRLLLATRRRKAMAKLRITIEGRPGSVSLSTFRAAVDRMEKLLGELETSIGGDTGSDLRWVITDLSLGSLVVEIDSQAPPDRPQLGPEVARAAVAGIEQIEKEGTTPPYFTERALRRARDLIRLVGHDGVQGLTLTADGQSVEISHLAAPRINALLKVKRSAIGSVEGWLETISVHGQDRFIIYHSGTGKSIECIIRSPQQLARAKEGFGRRVNVAGIVYSNARGEPMRVDVESIRIFPDDHDLPTIAELSGSDPNFTGGLSTDEFIRSIRGE
jgi:hypothetical protein